MCDGLQGLESWGIDFLGEVSGISVEFTGYPTNVAQALWEMPEDQWDAMVIDMFGHDVEIEDVLNLIRETNTSLNRDGVIEVWIDKVGDFKIEIH